jgi:hypothetical protein
VGLRFGLCEELRFLEELRVYLHGELRVGVCEYWTTGTHKTRKETGMNLENVRYKIAKSVEISVHNSMWNSMGKSVWNSVGISAYDSMYISVWHSVWNSVGGGLQLPIREERDRR